MTRPVKEYGWTVTVDCEPVAAFQSMEYAIGFMTVLTGQSYEYIKNAEGPVAMTTRDAFVDLIEW